VWPAACCPLAAVPAALGCTCSVLTQEVCGVVCLGDWCWFRHAHTHGISACMYVRMYAAIPGCVIEAIEPVESGCVGGGVVDQAATYYLSHVCTTPAGSLLPGLLSEGKA
jgi:hypothetical protein